MKKPLAIISLLCGAILIGASYNVPSEVSPAQMAAALAAWSLSFTGDVTGSGPSPVTLAMASSVNLPGAPTAATATLGTNTTQLATTAYVGAAVAAVAYTLPAATATTLGGMKGNLSLFDHTTSPVSVTIGAITVLGASVLPSISVTVTGVTAGDFVLASFNGTPPTGITLSGVQVTANNTVLVTPVATAALTLSSTSVPLNFAWMH